MPSASSSKRSNADDHATQKLSVPSSSAHELPTKRSSRKNNSLHGPVSLGKSDESEGLSDSDEAPEVLTIAAGKKQIKEKQSEVHNFARATAQARRQANRARDEKLKRNSKARKTNLSIAEKEESETSASEEQKLEADQPSKPSIPAIPNTKKYLDPSLFASASHSLEQSKQASQARAMQEAQFLASRRRKHKKLENQNWRDLGNNTMVVHLPQSEHLGPAPRPVSASNFVRNRLQGKPRRSAVRLPKSTIAAKAELGIRNSTIETISARRANKPAAVFARS